MSPSPLRRLLLQESLTVVGLAGLIVAGSGWWGARAIMRAQAQARAEAGLREVERRVAQSLDEAVRTGEALADRGRLGQLAPAGTLAGEQQLLAELHSRPGLTNLTFVGPDGRASAANLPDEAAPHLWLTRGTEGPAAAHQAVLRRWDAQNRLVSQGPDPAAPPDWRSRPWVMQALREGRPGWTPPYPFLGKVGYGLTYTVPIARAGEPVGVLGVDLVLGDLRPWMREARPTEGTRLAILDGEGRLILPPEQDLEAAALGRALAPEGLDAQRHPIPAAVRAHPEAGQPGRWPRVRVGGEAFLIQRRRIRVAGGPDWEILAAIPEEDLLRDPRRMALGALILGLIALGLLAWRLTRNSRRVVQPLEALAALAQRLTEGKVIDPPRTGIAEVADLGASLRLASLALAEQAQLEAQLRLAQRRDLVGTLAAGVAHDLGNLLSAVGANLEFAQDPGVPPADQAKSLAKASLALRRSLGFLKALLAVGRPQEKQDENGHRPVVDLVQVLRDSAELLEPLLGSFVALRLDLPALPLPVQADPIQLEQVLLNLSLNGRDAMPKGGTLTLSAGRTPEGRPYLAVQDEGSGIPDHLRDQLFTPFFTTKGPGKGTGLGLAMVQGIARTHGARIEVSSRMGEGSRFTLLFPEDDPDIVGSSHRA
ncbi:MAG TPA: ATP-binding protein [Holophagaceae bacterium]|nr:ATP-binding protein [Holophagaceae bacterium]